MSTNKKNVSETDTKTPTADSENAADNMEKETAATTGATPTEKERYKGITKFAYIGPPLPGGRLKKFTVLNGTYAQIMYYYKEVIARYPGIARLIVPVAQLAESREKIQTSGNFLYNNYQEVAAAIKAKGDEK